MYHIPLLKSGNCTKLFFNDYLMRNIMARPIRETPVLYGEEARKFELRMQNPPRLSAKQIERMQRDYEFMRSRCVNCTF